jgi:hypothetical protein
VWAVVRIVLGQAQIIGATVSLYCLIATGANALTMWAVSVTGLLVVASKLLFRDSGTGGVGGRSGGRGAVPPVPSRWQTGDGIADESNLAVKFQSAPGLAARGNV